MLGSTSGRAPKASSAKYTQKDGWSDAFVYFKHEESGIGPKLATQLLERLGGTVV